jgi:hypothetical protein
MKKALKSSGAAAVTLFAGILAAAPIQAQESDAKALREAVTCRPVKAIARFLKKIDEIPAKDRSLVDTFISLQVKALDGGDLPQRLYVKTNDQEKTLLLDEAGFVKDFAKLSSKSEESFFCIEDPSRAGRVISEPGLNVHMSTVTKYKSASGTHDIETLLAGMEQGKAHYKKTFGGGVKNAFIPSIDHVLVSPIGGQPLPKVSVLGASGPVDVDIEQVSYGPKVFFVLSVKEMRKAGAQSLLVDGGYELKPVPSVKKLRKFGMID